METTEIHKMDLLVDKIVHNVNFKTILNTNYTEYFDTAIQNEEIDYTMIKEKLLNSTIQQRLNEKLGLSRIKLFLTIPNKVVLWRQMPMIENSRGRIQPTLDNLLQPPSHFEFEELPNDFFNDKLEMFEKLILRKRANIQTISLLDIPNGHRPDYIITQMAMNEASVERMASG